MGQPSVTVTTRLQAPLPRQTQRVRGLGGGTGSPTRSTAQASRAAGFLNSHSYTGHGATHSTHSLHTPLQEDPLTHLIPSPSPGTATHRHTHCGPLPLAKAQGAGPRLRKGPGWAGRPAAAGAAWRDHAPRAGMPASGQGTAVPEPARTAPPGSSLPLQFPWQERHTAASHLDVRELAQVRVHGQQRLVHQLLVVIHPEQVVVLRRQEQVSAPPGHQPPQPQLSSPRNLGAQLLPHHFKAQCLLKTSVSSLVKWASSRGQQGPWEG